MMLGCSTSMRWATVKWLDFIFYRGLLCVVFFSKNWIIALHEDLPSFFSLSYYFLTSQFFVPLYTAPLSFIQAH